MVVFAIVAAILIVITEGDDDDDKDHDVGKELAEQIGLAFAIAAPISLTIAVTTSRWLTRRATARVDELITAAATLTATDIEHRLPISGADDELNDLALALNDVFARINQGVSAQRQFAADASHELRSPLAVAASMLEVARRRDRSAKEWETVADSVLDELGYMSNIVDSLLSLARTGDAGLRREPVDIASLLDDVVERARPAAAAAKVTLTASMSADHGESTASVDRAALAIAIENLVINAIAHSPQAGVVEITASIAEHQLEISVIDAGASVAVEDRERIFRPFVRAAVASADRVRRAPSHSGLSRLPRVGLGLGLSIVDRIARGHGGTCVVDEAPTGGARFTLRLPMRTAS